MLPFVCTNPLEGESNNKFVLAIIKLPCKSLSLVYCCSAISARPERTSPTLSAVFSPTCVAFLTAAACCLISSIVTIY